MHISIDYNRLYHNLMEQEIKGGISLRVFHYSLRQINMKHIPDEYVDSYNSTIRLRRSPLFFKTRIRFVAKQFCELYKGNFQYDLVHAHMLFSDGEIAYQAYKAWGVPYIIAVRNNDMNSWYYWDIPWNKQHGYEILKNASKVVFLSQAYKSKLSNRLPLDLKVQLDKKSIVIPNGIENFWHDNARKGPKRISDNIIKIITVGSIESNKNQITVLKAVELLRRNGYKAEYTIVGEIKDRGIEKKLKNCPYVKLLPFCSKEKLIQVYEEADIFVLSSIHETFGLVYAEAMSQGLPVIYSRGEGFDQQFPEGYIGISVDSKAPEEIYNAIIKILPNYESISERCIKASSVFDWEIISQKYLDLYSTILQSKNY